MPKNATACPLDCPDTCGVLVETDDEGAFVRIGGNPEHSYSRGSLCGKTAIFGELLNAENRLRHPLLRKPDGEFEPVSWERAIERIVERTKGIAGERILALSYAGCMGLVNRNYPARVMHELGATETDGGICDNTATAGFEAVFGHVIGADVETMADTDLLILWGVEARRTHQHLMRSIQDLCQRGVPVIAIDIWRSDTIRSLEKWGGRGLVLNQGTDASLALALARLAFEEDAVDSEFLASECVGAGRFREHVLEHSGTTLEEAARETGIPADAIRVLGRQIADARHSFLKTGVGFTRRRNGGMSMRAVCSLAALHGSRMRLHFESPDHFAIDSGPMTQVEQRREPRRIIRHVELGAELESGRFGAVFVWGHNPAVTVPDSNRVRAGLARDDLFLVVHELFMTDTAALADVVLPATAFVEQSDIYRSYGHRVLQYGAQTLNPPDDQKSNVETFSLLARALGLPQRVWDVDEAGLCQEMLESMRARIGDEDLARVAAGEPVKLRERDVADRGTPSGKIELFSESLEAAGEPPMASYVPDDGAGGSGAYRLISAPSIATHNSTYLYSKRHARRAGGPRCYLSARDAARLPAQDGAQVRLSNEHGQITLILSVSDDVPHGAVRVDGFPDPASTPEGVSINAITSPKLTDIGDGNVLYSARVDIHAL